MAAGSWKKALEGRMSDVLAEEVEIFENQLELRRQGKLDEKVLAETRLRRGVYGQRYDNGQRHDGAETRTLTYPCGDLTKGPETVWDAPGMVRIKIPFGGLSPDQLDVLAALAEEYSDNILHVTTRQDFQLHFVHIDDTPDLMRRLAVVGITTREACGNSVRNITGCPLAGVCRTETFDISPYADALMKFLLGHPDVQDFGRKFKPAFSGCAHEACGLVMLHDSGYVAKIQDGKRGFAMYVGGGLGPVPHQAKLLYEFIPEEDLLPATQAVARVYARLGEKRNRNRARVKFLVAKLGIEEFRRLVDEERPKMPHDERWTAYLKDIDRGGSQPIKDAVPLTVGARGLPAGYAQWAETNVYKQRQAGYVVATVNLPLGDLTSAQSRALADVSRKYVGENMRTTVEQNIVLRWVSESDLPDLYQDLQAIGLATPGAGTIVDITACPGTDTCKLGIAASRGLAGELRTRLSARSASMPRAIADLKIKISGCFNSCGQHHAADIGFYGNSRKVGNHAVPHFQVVLGGQWDQNAGSYGLAIEKVPSKAVPAVVDALADRFLAEREGDERFQDFIARLGKKEVRSMLQAFKDVPDYAADAAYYSDWGDPREFTIGDMGIGECAGEVVSLFSMEISKAESQAFDAQLALDEDDPAQADETAYRAMIMAARALVRTQHLDVGDEPDNIVREFRERFYDTKLFFDKYATGKFANYLFDRHAGPSPTPDLDSARRLIEEAQLFIEAAHACDARMIAAAGTVPA
ncbi:MAG: nitrite/sulfite reductase [Phycisphaerae bacterium]|nr:nitrite/sulfite reductase [Phycisphaerae bacterium]